MSKSVKVKVALKSQSQFEKWEEQRKILENSFKFGDMQGKRPTAEEVMWSLRKLGYGRKRACELVNSWNPNPSEKLDWSHYPIHGTNPPKENG